MRREGLYFRQRKAPPFPSIRETNSISKSAKTGFICTGRSRNWPASMSNRRTCATSRARPASGTPGPNRGRTWSFGFLKRSFPPSIDYLPEPPTIFFGGFGEPLFHPEILRMVREAKKINCRVELITNGVLLKGEILHGLLEAGLDFLWVSIDGSTPETYADVRLGNELPNILDNLHTFRRLKYRYSSKKPALGVSFVLMKRSLHDFPEVVELSLRLGARRIMVTNVLPYSKEMKQEVVYAKSMSQFNHRFQRIDLPRIDLTTETIESLDKVLKHFELPEIAPSEFSAPYDTCPFVEAGKHERAGRRQGKPLPSPVARPHQLFRRYGAEHTELFRRRPCGKRPPRHLERYGIYKTKGAAFRIRFFPLYDLQQLRIPGIERRRLFRKRRACLRRLPVGPGVYPVPVMHELPCGGPFYPLQLLI